LNGLGMNKRYPVTCSGCGQEWQPEIEFNPSTFFASAS